MFRRIKSFGPLFIIIAALLWSFDAVLRRSLYSLPPAVVVFYEHLFGAIILIPLFKKWSSDLAKMGKKEWIAIIIVSLFSGALGTIFYTAALGKVNYIQYSVVVLLQQLQPIWAISAAYLIVKEKRSKKFLIWAALALASAYFITFRDLQVNFSTGTGTIVAAVLALSAGFMWGASTAISKFVLNKVSFMTAIALRFYLAPIFAFLIIFINRQSSALLSLNTNQLITLVLITFSTGFVALAIYYYGLKKVPASSSTIYELVWPASAIFIDYFYYKSTFSITQFIGVFVLLISIYKITRLKVNQ